MRSRFGGHNLAYTVTLSDSKHSSKGTTITMAEAVVGALIGKLGTALAKEAATYGASLLYKEASAIKGLFGEIRRVERELENEGIPS